MKLDLQRFGKSKADANPVPVFSVLQGVSVVAGVLGTLLAVGMGVVGAMWLSLALEGGEMRVVWACGVGFATLLAVSAACIVALACFYLLCGRLKTGTAFTEHNARAMGAIARCFGLSALVLIVALPVLRLLIGETLLPMIYVAVVAFLFGFAALLSHALSLLVWRAQALQAENDLTI